MKRISIPKKAWLPGLLWGLFAAVTALGLRGCRLSAEGSLLQHLRYALAYGGLRGKAVCLVLVGCAVLFSLIGWSCLLTHRPGFRPAGILLALLFALNTMCFVSSTGELGSLWKLPQGDGLSSAVYWLGLTGSYYLMIFSASVWLNRADTGGKADLRVRAWPFALVIFAAWLPTLVLRFPGYLLWDSARQILQFQGKIMWEASHPLFLTVVFGSLFTLGQRLAGDAGGLAFCGLLQTGLMLLAMTVLCAEAARRRGRKWVGYVCALFFGLTPVWTTLAPSIIKDSVHAPLFLLFVIYYGRVLRAQTGKKRETVLLCILALLCALTRKGGTWLMLLSLLGLAIYKKGLRKCLLGCCAGLLAVEVLLSQVLCPLLNIEKPKQQENYSLLYPIVGYYCKNYSQELTEQEKKILSDVLDYEAVCTAYSPTYVDPIKNTFHAENEAQVMAFLGLTGRFLLRHPLTCLQAVVYSKNAYFTPFTTGVQLAYYYQDSPEAYAPLEGSEFPFLVETGRRIGWENRIADWTGKFPWSLFTGAGIYTWALLVLFVSALWKKDRKKRMELLPVLLLTAGLLLTHVNGAVRYACPVMMSVPYLLATFRTPARGTAEEPEKG